MRPRAPRSAAACAAPKAVTTLAALHGNFTVDGLKAATPIRVTSALVKGSKATVSGTEVRVSVHDAELGHDRDSTGMELEIVCHLVQTLRVRWRLVRHRPEHGHLIRRLSARNQHRSRLAAGAGFPVSLVDGGHGAVGIQSPGLARPGRNVPAAGRIGRPRGSGAARPSIAWASASGSGGAAAWRGGGPGR